jgi:CRISPR-associated protein Cmr5
MQTKEQQRAAFALMQIEEQFDNRVDEKTANFIVGTPTMILCNGLGQTMAFLLSKKKEPKQKAVFDFVRAWLEKEKPHLAALSDMEFLKKFTALSQADYLDSQRESLAVLQWLKRYARAFQEEKEK